MPKFFPSTKQVVQNKKYPEKNRKSWFCWFEFYYFLIFLCLSSTIAFDLKKKKKVLKLLVLKPSTIREAFEFHSRGKHRGIPETQAEFIGRQHFPP